MVFDFRNSHPKSSYVHQARSKHYRSRQSNVKEITASVGGPSSLSTGGPSRFGSTNSNLLLGNVSDEWTPKEMATLNALLRLIQGKDDVASPAIELMSSLPWSDADLIGVDDSKILDIYRMSWDNLRAPQLMKLCCAEKLTIGRVVGNLIFDDNSGSWVTFVPADPDFVEILASPITNLDPIIDSKVSPGFKKLLDTSSSDSRVEKVLSILDNTFLNDLRSGKIKHNPSNTVFMPRRSILSDVMGTSILVRVISWWALQQSLLSGTLIQSKRRQRGLLHLEVGIDEVWEPTDDELNNIIDLFQSGDEDPYGAIIATRKGIAANEMRDAKSAWTIVDDIDVIKAAKLRAFNMNESMITGEASFNTLEHSLGVFMKSLRSMRAEDTDQFWTNKAFPTLARLHGFTKVSKAELEHRVTSKVSTDEITKDACLAEAINENYTQKANEIVTASEAGEVSKRTAKKSLADLEKETLAEIRASKLLIPIVRYHEKLEPSSDDAYFNLLKSAKEEGLPVTLQLFANAVGINIDDLQKDLEKDGELRKKFFDWQRKMSSMGGQQSEDGQVVASVLLPLKKDIVSMLPIWKVSNEITGLKKAEALACVSEMINRGDNFLSDLDAVQTFVSSRFSGNKNKTAAMFYVLRRSGISDFTLSEPVVSFVLESLKTNEKNLRVEVEALQKIARESNDKYANASTVVEKLMRHSRRR